MKRFFPVLMAVLCAFLALMIASSSSFLYATNFWTDTNIYFTIGRGMTQGLMPYRDLFDHKGPLLFMLYALGACVSKTGFIGVFMLEVASLAAALYSGWRTVCLYGEGRLSLLAMPLTATAACCCTAFTQGGSAEEFCLPALVMGIALTLALLKNRTAHPKAAQMLFGAAAGWVFLIKYTDCGLRGGADARGRHAGLPAHGGLSGGKRRAERLDRRVFYPEPFRLQRHTDVTDRASVQRAGLSADAELRQSGTGAGGRSRHAVYCRGRDSDA